ncbi:MAG TPA: hypothetical protein VH189_00720 [Rhizomicrobium sp.]|nr:hypothetical protein [Rhizomicrobium sp.]
MRAELPWNVAGIPPEVREAARAAARREGLSVGEWLTRHILRSFSGLEEDASRSPAGPLLSTDQGLDSWGLPQPAPGRSDSGEMPTPMERDEAESGEAWRHIEEQLRGIGRRLDSNERSHSESNRFLSRTAQEMNAGAREQAQAFAQLSQTVGNLRERLERLERSAPGDNIREAIKALHLGLSRLAEQLTANAGKSAGQMEQVTANLEKLAVHVGKVWENADTTALLLNQRIELAQTEFAQRLQDSERTLAARLSAAEKTTQFNTNALDHALEKIETAARERAADLTESQRHAVLHEENLRELRDSVSDMEGRLPGMKLEARLNAIERSVGGLKEAVAQHDPVLVFGAAVQQLRHRLEKLEHDHAGPAEGLETKPVEEPAEPATTEPGPIEAPAEVSTEAFAEVLPEPDAREQETLEPDPPVDVFAASEPQEPIAQAPESEIKDIVFVPRDLDFNPPRETPEDESDIAFLDVFVESKRDEVLAEARRSAQAALERAESERIDRLSSLYENHTEVEDRPKSRYLIPVAAALLVAIVAITTLVMSERAKRLGEQLAANPTTDRLPALPALPDSAQSAATPPAGISADSQVSGPDNDQTAEIAPRNAARAAQPAETGTADAAPVPDKNTPKTKNIALAAGDRVMLLANAGNPVALAILGLRALDGTGGAPIDLPSAIKFLTLAADKGQAVAQYRLGTLYERGQGVAADPGKAMHWYELAASQGNRKAMHNLAVAYASGPPAKRNMTEAARWFTKAAALGLADSQFNLAVLCERGDGVPLSLADAYKWYAIAALSGDGEAKARMSVLATQLSDSEKAAADKSTASFHASPLIRSVNVPPEPADLGT